MSNYIGTITTSYQDIRVDTEQSSKGSFDRDVLLNASPVSGGRQRYVRVAHHEFLSFLDTLWKLQDTYEEAILLGRSLRVLNHIDLDFSGISLKLDRDTGEYYLRLDAKGEGSKPHILLHISKLKALVSTLIRAGRDLGLDMDTPESEHYARELKLYETLEGVDLSGMEPVNRDI